MFLFSSFIYALGIPNVGSKTASDLVDHLGSLDNIKCQPGRPHRSR